MTAGTAHFLHLDRVPWNTSITFSGTISRQKGHTAMTASQSSEHVHALASLTMQPQHRGWQQQRACITLRVHLSSGQNGCAHMKHSSSLSSESPPASPPLPRPPPPRRDTLKGMDNSITAAPAVFLWMRGMCAARVKKKSARTIDDGGGGVVGIRGRQEVKRAAVRRAV